MKKIFLSILFMSAVCFAYAQRADSVSRDSVIKERLVALAMKNPDMNIADANIRIAQWDLRKSKSVWLGSIAATGNANEFVITNSSAASFFPRYNLGVAIPFDIFSKARNAKKVAEQNVVISNEMRNSRIRQIRSLVLTRYENYKEKKELVSLQKIYMESTNQAYLNAQKSVTEGSMQLDELNRVYQAYINEKSKLVSKERDLNVAVIELEEVIGVPLSFALN